MASLRPTLFFILATLFINAVLGIREVRNSDIAVPPAAATCQMPNRTPGQRACPVSNWAGAQTSDIKWLPPDTQCPCPCDGSAGIGQMGATGKSTFTNPDVGFFQDYQLVSGFINPIGISFADDGKTLFVGTRDGIIWHVDITTGVKTMFYDISLEVGFSGDRGLMDVRAHPNYANVRQMLIMYVVDDTPGDGVEPIAESAMNQRLIRVSDQDLDGIRDPNFRLYIFGENDVPPFDGPALCFNTHAVGSIQFGWDASLFVSTGEGGHWNFDMGDWGQDSPLPGSLDASCRTRFGAAQDVGAFRSQILESLSGKILRITPDTGNGICTGPSPGNGYPVKNPYCALPTDAATSTASRIWALGARNPFRMTVRPPILPGEPNGPGVPYFGDVGQGGYEEVNAVIQKGMNFGWPCWEGPLPCPLYRDAQYNFNLNYSYSFGCKGNGGDDGPCLPIQTIPRGVDGTALTCAYMYNNMTTDQPFFYYSRFQPFDNAGYFGEIGYLGQGFIGSASGGQQFYRGTSYPSRFYGQLFSMDFSEKWIRVLYHVDGTDIYDHSEEFATLIFTPPVDGAKVTIESHPNGDLCYVTMNGGEVRCFRYVVTNVAPAVSCSADNLWSKTLPFTVKFNIDGTFDRENDQVSISWDFGDGSARSIQANPSHVYNGIGPFTAVVVVTDQFGNKGNCSLTVIGNNQAPTVRISSPVPDISYPEKLVYINPSNTYFFSSSTTDDQQFPLSYFWEFTLVHNNHIHTGVYVNTNPSLSFLGSALPNEGNLERNNLLVFLTVTDAQGATAKDFIRFSRPGMFPNSAPVPSWNTNPSFSPLQVGQPVRFDATATSDPDGDRIDYLWQWGDGSTGFGVATSHFFSAPGTYNVNLTVVDNWGAYSYLLKPIVIGAATAIRPSIAPIGNKVYAPVPVTITTIDPVGTIFYTIDGSSPYSSPTRQPYVSTILLPFTPYKNLTVQAITSRQDGSAQPSAITSQTFQFFPPPCDVVGIKPGCSLDCINPVNVMDPSTPILLPFSNLGPGTLPTDDKMVRYLVTGLNGTFDASKNATRLKLQMDASAAGQIVQARFSYDFTNDGTWDRIELFDIFAPNDVTGDYELYMSANQNANSRYYPVGGVVGTYQNLVMGAIRLEIWQASATNFGRVILLGGAANAGGVISTIEIPYITDSTSMNVAKSCVQCSGNIVADVCGTCGGPGKTGCDQQCFSTKSFDVCGACGGPGKTGCDSQCNSTKVVDTCGVCGGGSNACTIPLGYVSATELALRGNPGCSDMIPEIGNTRAFQNLSIPNPAPASYPIDNGLPTNPAVILSLEIRGLTGFYNIDRGQTSLRLYLDSLRVAGQQIGVAVQYDFDGSGYTRTEIYQPFATNDLPSFEPMIRIAQLSNTGAGLQPNLANNLPPYKNMTNGKVKLSLWICAQGAGNGPAFLQTDGGASFRIAPTSYISIPYITIGWPNTAQVTSCGTVTVRTNDIVTTGIQTTFLQTTSAFTTSRATTQQGVTTQGVFTTNSITTEAIQLLFTTSLPATTASPVIPNGGQIGANSAPQQGISKAAVGFIIASVILVVMVVVVVIFVIWRTKKMRDMRAQQEASNKPQRTTSWEKAF